MKRRDPELNAKLMHAAAEGDAALTRQLLHQGAAPNEFFSVLDSPLYQAVGGGHLDVVRLLLQNGAELDAHHLSSDHAAASGHVDVLDVLLSAAAEQSQTAAPTAAKSVNVRTRVKQAVQSAGMAACEAWGWDELPVNAINNVVRRLIARGLDVNQADDYHTMLAGAATVGNVALMRLLVESGADANKAGDALFAGIRGSQIESVRLLVDLGVNVDEPDGSPLMAAVEAVVEAVADPVCVDRARAVAIVKLLLERGADTSKRHAATRAASAGLTDVVVAFLNAGAPLICGLDNKTLRDVALGHSRHEVVACIDAFIQSQALAHSQPQGESESGAQSTKSYASPGVRL